MLKKKSYLTILYIHDKEVFLRFEYEFYIHS